jgi:hypothetical protein
MTKSRLVQAAVCLALVVFFVFGQPAFAQENHFHIKVIPRVNGDHSADKPAVTLTKNLYGLQAAFTQGYPTIGVNADESDLWPCFGDTATTNSDCPTIGNPSIAFPTGGVVVGTPAYVWDLNNTTGSGNGYGCNADTNGTTATSYLPCGQTATWYEDDTGDSTDELLYSIVVTQGANTLVDSGTVDFGPNIYGGLTPPADIIIYGDQNFGTWPGATTGKNNANCTADYNYPLAAAANPGATYIIQANKTCKDPVAGAATLTATTEVAAPIYKKITTAAGCAPVSAPCYTVTYTKKYSLSQKWTIFLE